jgi:hypothetical protein
MNLVTYLFVALGVFVSIVLPLLKALLPKPTTTTLSKSAGSVLWTKAKPYVITGVFSLVVAVIVVAVMGDTINNWQKAILAGYTADATLQKLTTSTVT